MKQKCRIKYKHVPTTIKVPNILSKRLAWVPPVAPGMRDPIRWIRAFSRLPARIDSAPCDVRRRHQRNGEKPDPLIGPPLCYVGQTRCSITRFLSWRVKKLTAICCGKICFRHFAQGGAQSSCAGKVSLSLWTLTKSWACPETTRPQKIQFEVMVLSSQLIQPGLPSAPPVRTRASLLFCFWFTIGPFAWDHAVCRATAPSRWPAR